MYLIRANRTSIYMYRAGSTVLRPPTSRGKTRLNIATPSSATTILLVYNFLIQSDLPAIEDK